MKKWFVVDSGVAPIYNKYSFKSECLTESVYGESCLILGVHKNWYQIKSEDGYEGWVNSFYGSRKLEKNKNSNFITSPKSNGHFSAKFPFGAIVCDQINGSTKIPSFVNNELIIKIAKRLIGVPYKWGGKSSLGFDCSGFVQSVLKVCGLKIPRDSSQQLNYFKKNEISLHQALPGDLHFFGKQGRISHVGFSLGESKILHAYGEIRIDDIKNNKILSGIYLSSYSIKRKLS